MTDDQGREEQGGLLETMAKMLDEQAGVRRRPRLIAVVRHALGVQRLDGLRALDVGCSAGFIADEPPSPGRRRPASHRRGPAWQARARFGERVDFEVARGEAHPSTTPWTSSCSTTSTSTWSTPKPSSPTSTGCCARAGCSTSASATAGR